MAQEDQRLNNETQLPFLYKNIDFDHLRDDWPSAFDRLQQEFNGSQHKIDWQEFAKELELPSGWSWDTVKQQIAQSESPENRFNDVLRALFLAESAKTGTQEAPLEQPTDPSVT